MNEPVERAQASTGKVTARQLLDVVRKGERHFMHGRAVWDRPSYSDAFVFRFSSVHKDKNGIESTTTLDVPGWVSNGNMSAREERVSPYSGEKYMRYTDVYRPTDGFVSLWNYDLLVSAAEDPTSLPNGETFYLANGEMTDEEGEPLAAGWYYWACFPGCLPDGPPIGPFATEQKAIDDATNGGS